LLLQSRGTPRHREWAYKNTDLQAANKVRLFLSVGKRVKKLITENLEWESIFNSKVGRFFNLKSTPKLYLKMFPLTEEQ